MIKATIYTLTLLLSLLSLKTTAQFFIQKNKRSVRLNFETFNNLIVLKASIDNQPKRLLLDTGVEKTVLFDSIYSRQDSATVEKIKVRSLGSKDGIFALKQNKYIGFKNYINPNAIIYKINDENWQLSNKLGIDIDGIIGYDFFKNHIVKINYARQFIRVYNPEKFNRKLKAYHKTSIAINAGKPYLEAKIKTLNTTYEDLNLLFDLGASDAFWVIEDDKIKLPEHNFFDILGYGLFEPIYGYRSKAKSATILGYQLQKPRYAFVERENIISEEERNGLVGAEILRRFKLFINYPKNKIYTKPNNLFNDNFNYDKSGLILNYAGKTYTRIERSVATLLSKNNESSYSNSKKSETQTTTYMSVTDIVIIANIRPNSPASNANLKIGDRILSINNKRISRFKPKEINQVLSQNGNKKIKLEVSRDGKIFKESFILKSIFEEI